MKKRIFFVCAALLCVWTAMAQYGSSEVRVLVSPDRSDWTYQVGEKCTFTIRVLKAQNFLQDDVTIDYELGPEMYPVEKKTGVALKNGELKLKSALDVPGFLRCKVKAHVNGRTYEGLGTAAYSPQQI